MLLCLPAIICTTTYADQVLDVSGYSYRKSDSTRIYEDYYIDPDEAVITAEAPRNLILIFVESLETTYASTEDGGFQSINYMPKLTALADECVSFSSSDRLGGFHASAGTGWTTAALFSMQTGVPFSFPVQGNSMGEYASFAPGITALGDILAGHGYRQFFSCGSTAAYGGKEKLFKGHGDYTVLDLDYARGRYLPEDYRHFWGYEDFVLFDIAREELPKIAASGEPFNYTMLTVDMHHVGGYVCERCEETYNEPLANVISCVDRSLTAFIDWCREQPFYENTSIIIAGDHPRMDTILVESVSYYERTCYNCFINCPVMPEPERMINRTFTHMDMFPTILSAIGFRAEGNRLGLGTDLFSGMPTLAEEIGYDKLDLEISKYSEYYLNRFS